MPQKSIGRLSAASPIPIAESTDEQVAVRSTSVFTPDASPGHRTDTQSTGEAYLSSYWHINAILGEALRLKKPPQFLKPVDFKKPESREGYDGL